MSAPRSPWEAYEAKQWEAEIKDLPVEGEPVVEPVLDENGKPTTKTRKRQPGLRVSFRETGDAGALLDIVFGGVTGADKDRAMAKLVCSSVTNPPLLESQYNALSLGAKFALFTEIMTHVNAKQPGDFPGGAPASPKRESELTTVDGGSGAPRKSLATVTPIA